MNSFWRLVCVILVAAAFGCGPGEPGSGETDPETGAVVFSLGAFSAAADLSAIKYFRIRVYPSAPTVEDEDTLFDSLDERCVEAKGTEVKIRDLKAGKDRFVFYEGFSDSDCSRLSRVALGIRGGINIDGASALQDKAQEQKCSEDAQCAAIHPDAECDCKKDQDDAGKDLPVCKGGMDGYCTVTPPVFIPIYQVGVFNQLSEPSEGLKNKAATVTCKTDGDCQEQVHKAASCDQALGYCTVEGLPPFSPSRHRAFHAADTLPDGRVMLTGGFTRMRGGQTFVAGAPFFEVFNPWTGLFEKAAVEEDFDGPDVAMHRTTVLQGKKLLTSGGITEAVFEYEQGAELKLKMSIPFEYDEESGCPNAACHNFSDTLVAVGVADDSLTSGMLPRGVMGHRIGVVNKGSDANVVLSGGMTYVEDTNAVSSSDRYTLCGVDDMLSGKVVCDESEETALFAPRYSHADACLVQAGDGEPCDEYLLFGGVTSEQPAAEVFSSTGDDSFNKPIEFAEVTKLNEALFPLLARVEDEEGQPAKLYAFGGVGEDGGVSVQTTQDGVTLLLSKPDIVPQKIAVNLTTASMTTAGLDLKELESAGEVFRLFHTVSVLEGGRIMVAGGVGEDALPTRSVLFFEDPKTDALTYVGKAKLAEARFGHTATVITDGLLKGAVLVVGGFKVDKGSGAVLFAEGAEIYVP